MLSDNDLCPVADERFILDRCRDAVGHVARFRLNRLSACWHVKSRAGIENSQGGWHNLILAAAYSVERNLSASVSGPHHLSCSLTAGF